MLFTDLKLIEPILKALQTEGYTSPTPIQQQAIPYILQRRDLLGCAQTGTGKTAAFAIPTLQLLYNERQQYREQKTIKALVLTPTRELAIQIGDSFTAYGRNTGLKNLVIFGGVSQNPQVDALRKGVDILVATPGRLLDLMNQGYVHINQIKMLILDEADRMLDMGFHDDIMRIVGYLPKKRQTLLFSATMPQRIRKLANAILHNPQQINIAISQPAAGIDQQIYRLHDQQKTPLLKHILKQGYQSAIVFASRKEIVKSLYKELKAANVNTAAFHSDLEQKEREEILLRFKNRQLPVIIGTDALSRGIDVEGIDLVVNYDVPPDPEDYVHRIGRTARAATTGTAITFVNNRDLRRLKTIEQLIERPINEKELPGDLKAIEPAKETRPERSGGDHKKGGRRNDRRYGKKKHTKPAGGDNKSA